MAPNTGSGTGVGGSTSTSTSISRVGANGSMNLNASTPSPSPLATTSSNGSAKPARVGGTTSMSTSRSASTTSTTVTMPATSRTRKLASIAGNLTASGSSQRAPTNLTKPIKTGPSSKLNALPLSPNAHPRTDPLSALTALRKLLLSLVSSAASGRMGGSNCTGYRMTKEEHALAVYLVGVVDPFVYRGVRASGGGGLTGASASAASAGPGTATAAGMSDNGPPTSLPLVLRKPGFGIVDTPTEIIDAILSHVESKNDLLSIGFGCRRLYDVVFPRHWEYRVVRCKVSDVDVWKHLCGDRSLARNVRRLEVVDERTVCVASASMASTAQRVGQQLGAGSSATATILVPCTLFKRTHPSSTSTSSSSEEELNIHKKHERHLSAALLRMTGLTELKWACAHSPVSIGSGSVWGAICVRARGLRVLEVCDNLMFGPGGFEGLGEGSGSGEDSEEEEESGGGTVQRQLRPLLSMETAVFRSTAHSYGASKTPDISRIGSMLAQCPNLKSLEITYIPPRASPSSSHTQTQAQPHLTNPNARPRPLADAFLLSSLLPSSLIPSLPRSAPFAQPARWPALTHITLTNLRCSSPSALSAFLSAHICVEVLSLVDLVLYVPAGAGTVNGNSSSMLSLQRGALPRLREVNASRDIITAIMECPLIDLRVEKREEWANEKENVEDGNDDEAEDDEGNDDDDEGRVADEEEEDGNEERNQNEISSNHDHDSANNGNGKGKGKGDNLHRKSAANAKSNPTPHPKPQPPRRPLETIKGFKLSGNPHHHSHSSQSSHPHPLRTPDERFLAALHTFGGISIKRVEMAGWHDMDEVRRVVACVPRVTWLDVGRRIGGGGGSGPRERERELTPEVRGRRGETVRARERLKMREESGSAPSNMLEWTDLMATLPELVTMHSVRFFYEVSSSVTSAGAGASGVDNTASTSHSHSHHDSTSTSNDPALSSSTSHLNSNSATSSSCSTPLPLQNANTTANANISTMTRSRLRKNDEIASLLAWRCPKLRRVDHWEGAVGSCAKVVVLIRDGGSSLGSANGEDKTKGKGKGKGKERERGAEKEKEKEKEKVRWEVRRVKL